jgi:hypothetical protein
MFDTLKEQPCASWAHLTAGVNTGNSRCYRTAAAAAVIERPLPTWQQQPGVYFLLLAVVPVYSFVLKARCIVMQQCLA